MIRGTPEPAEDDHGFAADGTSIFGQPQPPTTTPPSIAVTPEPPVPEPKDLWALHESRAPLAEPEPTGSGQYFTWDGSQPARLQLSTGKTIRSIWFPNATNETISVYAGNTTGGSPIYQTTGAAELVAIADGNTVLMLSASTKFSSSITLYATHDVLPPNKVESIQLALASATVTISGDVNANITNASIPVTGSVNANVTGSVSITSGTVSISGTTSVNLTASSATVDILKTSDFPSGSTPYFGGASANATGTVDLEIQNATGPAAVVIPAGAANIYVCLLDFNSPGIDMQKCVGTLAIGGLAGATFTALLSFNISGNTHHEFPIPLKVGVGAVAGQNLAVQWTPTDTLVGTAFLSVFLEGYFI